MQTNSNPILGLRIDHTPAEELKTQTGYIELSTEHGKNLLCNFWRDFIPNLKATDHSRKGAVRRFSKMKLPCSI